MVVGVVPTIVTDTATFLGSIAAFCVAVGVLTKVPPVRFVWKRLVSDPFGQWTQRQVAAGNAETDKAIAKVQADLSEHKRLAGYHLGLNGNTKPIHQRLCDVEAQVMGVRDEQGHVRDELEGEH